MGLYISDEDVKIRLTGKIRFTDDLEDENRMSNKLLRRLVREAEGQVELDLTPRYQAPFQTIDGRAFKFLPESPTLEVLRTMCEIQGVLRCLATDFGRGSVMSGDEYGKKLDEKYTELRDKLVARWEDKQANTGRKGWMYPPLEGLKLAIFNTEADDGYAGMVIVTGRGRDQAFPHIQINDPAQNWTNGTFEDLE